METKKFAVNAPKFLTWINLSGNGKVTRVSKELLDGAFFEMKIEDVYYDIQERYDSEYLNEYDLKIPYDKKGDLDLLYSLIEKYESLYSCSTVHLNIITDFGGAILGAK